MTITNIDAETETSDGDPRSRAAAEARALLRGGRRAPTTPALVDRPSPDDRPSAAGPPAPRLTAAAPTATTPADGPSPADPPAPCLTAAAPTAPTPADPPAPGVTAAGPADPPAASAPVARRGPRSRHRLTIVALSVVCAGLAVALALTSLALSNRDAQAAARMQVLTTARADAVALTTYAYQHLQQDFAKVLDASTPAFRSTYTKSSGGLDTILESYKASATGRVLAAAVSSISSRTATVLLFVDQTTSNSTKKGPSVDESRISLTLQRIDGRWLIEKVNLL